MSKKEIHQKVEDTFKVLDYIDKVEVNHFFKHKVLQKLNAEKEEKKIAFSWLTPQFQLATLAIVLLLNVGTIFYTFSSSNDTSTNTIETFSKGYSLQSSNNSLLN